MGTTHSDRPTAKFSDPNSFKEPKKNWIVNGEKLIRGIHALCELVPALFLARKLVTNVIV
jgi:hypothetical protein